MNAWDARLERRSDTGDGEHQAVDVVLKLETGPRIVHPIRAGV
jgi:hypothetical protein